MCAETRLEMGDITWNSLDNYTVEKAGLSLGMWPVKRRPFIFLLGDNRRSCVIKLLECAYLIIAISAQLTRRK